MFIGKLLSLNILAERSFLLHSGHLHPHAPPPSFAERLWHNTLCSPGECGPLIRSQTQCWRLNGEFKLTQGPEISNRSCLRFLQVQESDKGGSILLTCLRGRNSNIQRFPSGKEKPKCSKHQVGTEFSHVRCWGDSFVVLGGPAPSAAPPRLCTRPSAPRPKHTPPHSSASLPGFQCRPHGL